MLKLVSNGVVALTIKLHGRILILFGNNFPMLLLDGKQEFKRGLSTAHMHPQAATRTGKLPGLPRCGPREVLALRPG